MVFEQIYPAAWVEKKTVFAFLMGFLYSVIGIASAIFIFPEDPGLPAVAFTTIILLPSIVKILSVEEQQAAKRKRFNLFMLYRDHRDVFTIYFFSFLGILLAFSFFSIVLPNLATSHIFREQVNILGLGTGKAHGGFSFFSIFNNNLKVLVFCLIFSFIYGAGAIFIITWNASVWGVIFGVVAKNSAAISGQNPFVYFILTIIAVSFHMFLEASSYFLGAISGGIISEASLKEKFWSGKFKLIVNDGLIVFLIAVVVLMVAAFIEVFVTGEIVNFFGL